MDSLTVAFTALLERYQLPIKKLKVGDPPTWEDITNCDERITVAEIGQGGTWPRSNDAIIKFRTQSADEPYTNHDGFQRANMIDAYCLVADAPQHLVFDSNGEIRESGAYGHPVEWAVYAVDVKRPPTDPGRLHKKLAGESIWSIARRFRVPSKDLIEHNDIEDPNDVPDGTVLHLPYPKQIPAAEVIHYEVFDTARPMHISNEGGAKKWVFGNAKNWSDITPAGPNYPDKTNLDIVGAAHVPIGKETAAYYLDSLSLGDFRETGRVRFSVGFNHSHLAEGYFIPEAPPPLEDIPEIEPVEPNKYKSSYEVFPAPVIYLAEKSVMVNEMDGRAIPGPLLEGKGVMISGTFEKDGTIYGRPKPGEHDFWYGIPMHFLKREDEVVYNYDVSLPEKVATKQPLKIGERVFWRFARATKQGMKVKDYLASEKNKKNKE